MKKIMATILVAMVIVSLAACSGKSNGGQNSDTVKTSQKSDNSSANNSKQQDGFINEDYSDKNELYAFVQSYLDYKKPAMEALEAKKSAFQATVAGLAGGDWAIDLPIKPLEEIEDLEKSGNSWEGTVGVYKYNITKSGDIYSFKFTHTAMEQVTEGECDINAGTLQLTVEGANLTHKYQVKALGNGAYLRFWSEKADVLEETRAHYTYFKGNDVAAGQEETKNPKELIGSNYKDDTYAENDETWVKYVGGKTSDFDGINN